MMRPMRITIIPVNLEPLLFIDERRVRGLKMLLNVALNLNYLYISWRFLLIMVESDLKRVDEPVHTLSGICAVTFHDGDKEFERKYCGGIPDMNPGDRIVLEEKNFPEGFSLRPGVYVVRRSDIDGRFTFGKNGTDTLHKHYELVRRD